MHANLSSILSNQSVSHPVGQTCNKRWLQRTSIPTAPHPLPTATAGDWCSMLHQTMKTITNMFLLLLAFRISVWAPNHLFDVWDHTWLIPNLFETLRPERDCSKNVPRCRLVRCNTSWLKEFWKPSPGRINCSSIGNPSSLINGSTKKKFIIQPPERYEQFF